MRLRSVRMKDGGATISVLHTARNDGDPDQPENWRGVILSQAKRIADYDEPDSHLDGFIVIGMFSDGTTSIGCRLPERIPRALIPAYVNEILRRDVITEREAARVFDRKFEWVDR